MDIKKIKPKKITTPLGIFLESGKPNETFIVTKAFEGQKTIQYCTATAARFKRKVKLNVIVVIDEYGKNEPIVCKYVKVTIVN